MSKWQEIINKDALNVGYSLANYAQQERDEGRRICPPQDQIFRALELTPPENVKVCIVGQDPYHTKDVANGLAFSVASEKPFPPSLANIFRELQNDLNISYPTDGDLVPWASKGVLLLNSSLTVYEGLPNSHSNWGWQKFTEAILQSSYNLPQPVVFLLLGAYAQGLRYKLIRAGDNHDKGPHIIINDKYKKAFIQTSHPSPFSVNRPCQRTPAFRGSKPFSTINSILQAFGSDPIDWNLS